MMGRFRFAFQLDFSLSSVGSLPFLYSLATGQSGVTQDGPAFPMKLGILILPKNRVFGAHAHPTIELELTLRGALGEVRLVAGGKFCAIN